MTEYTENFNLGKQTDKHDKFNMTVICENWDIIDNCLKNLDDRISKVENNSGLLSASISANTLSGVAENGEFTPINEYFEE